MRKIPTMERIATALNVSHGTVVSDLRNLSATDKLKHAKTATNPKGAGLLQGFLTATSKFLS
jgi:DeoR/GlpR family transcriptional regulator of sugar metabolism